MINANHVHDDLRVTKIPAGSAEPYGLSNSSVGIGHTCPSCKGPLVRIWRRPVDRLTSQFVQVQRFHCERFACGWEGNFRVDAADPANKTSFWERASTVFLVALVLVTSAALIVTLAIAVVGWISSYDQLREQIGLYSQPHPVVIQASADLISRKAARLAGNPRAART